ncbi:MAG: hypothetical protein EA398_08040 [Deltaproteobacteria bacterium]|nr:MAG: hypothetical protein EA398_08040 [Deltaproteobacteria bacterium]
MLACAVAGFASLAWSVVVHAEDGAGERERTRSDRLPGPVRAADLQRVDEALQRAMFPVRIREDLGAGFHPRYVHAEGVATLVQASDDSDPLLLFPLGPLDRADRITVYVGDVGHVVETRWASAVHGVTALDVSSIPDGVARGRALPLAEEWPSPPDVYVRGPHPVPEADDNRTGGASAASTTPATTLQGSGTPLLHPGTLDAQPARIGREQTLLIHSPFRFRNGYPIVNVHGELVALSSFPAATRRGEVLAVPMTLIRDWYENRDRIDPEGSGQLRPRVIEEQVEPTTGEDALRPRSR